MRIFPRLTAWSRAHPDRLALTLIVLVALLPRAALMFRLPALYVVGSRPYYSAALQLVSGLEPTALSLRHTPGYPAFLIGVIGLFGVEPLAIVLVQHLLGVGSALLAYAIGRLVGGRMVGLLAGLLTAANTMLVLYEQHILTEPLFTFLILLSILLLVLAVRRGPGGLFVLAGLTIGLAALTRPIGQALLLAAPPAIWLNLRRLRPTLLACLLLAVGFGLGAGPWVVRNALTQGEAGVRSPGSTLLGRVVHKRPFTQGLFTAQAADDPDPTRAAARRIIERMAPSDPDPLEMWTELQSRLQVSPAAANRLMGELAFETIGRYPLHYLPSFALDVVNLFMLSRDETWDDFDERQDDQWPGRFLVGPIKADLVPDLNPSQRTIAQRWEAGRVAAIVDLFRPTLAAPLLAALFLVAVAGALLEPRQRLVLVPALAVLGIVLVNGIVAGDKPRYRYPLDPAIGIVALCGAQLLASRAWGMLRGSPRRLPAEPGPATPR